MLSWHLYSAGHKLQRLIVLGAEKQTSPGYTSKHEDVGSGESGRELHKITQPGAFAPGVLQNRAGWSSLRLLDSHERAWVQ